jgi:hypothetical protein
MRTTGGEVSEGRWDGSQVGGGLRSRSYPVALLHSSAVRLQTRPVVVA